MKRYTSVVLVVLLLLLGFIVVGQSRNKDDKSNDVAILPTPEETKQENTPLKDPTFEWSYRSFEEAEIPRTAITLTARDASGTVLAKKIDTIEGGCNDYEQADLDVYLNSKMIICYYAGLRRYYKVTQSDGGYAVERKIFEEGSPDYNPPLEQFEVIARF